MPGEVSWVIPVNQARCCQLCTARLKHVALTKTSLIETEIGLVVTRALDQRAKVSAERVITRMFEQLHD